MKIVTVCIPGQLTRETRNSLRKHWRRPLETNVHFIEKEDPFAYVNLISDYWKQGESFAVVEPDIVIRKDVAEAFTSCECLYGCFPYNWTTDVGPALGCTWFRAEFLKEYPDAMEKVKAKNVTWRQLDVVLMRHVLAREYGQQPHVHLPAVQHLNKPLLPEASPEPMMSVPHW